jgi:hypothetical protein
MKRALPRSIIVPLYVGSNRCCSAGSAGVSPAVAGASRSRTPEVLTSPLDKESMEAEGARQEGAGTMPTPQRARRPRYVPSAPHVPARCR